MEKGTEIAAEVWNESSRSRPKAAHMNDLSTPEKIQESDSDHEIEFQEGDQLIRMAVDKDDSFYESDSESSSEDCSESSSRLESYDEQMSGVEEQAEDKRNSEMLYHQ